MAERYLFPSTVGLVSGAASRLVSLEVEFASQTLRLTYEIEQPNGTLAIRSALVARNLNRLNQFLNAAPTLSGTTFEEKLLMALPSFVAEIPAGGTLDE